MSDFKENKETEKALSEEEQKAFWMKAMGRKRSHTKPFASYHPTSIESFKSHYINQKCHWLQVGPRFNERTGRFQFLSRRFSLLVFSL